MKTMVRLTFSILFVGLIAVPVLTGSAAAVEQQKLDQVVDIIERLCLSGSSYQFSANANGQITITRILPGGAGEIAVNVKNQPGGVGYLNEEIRKVVDADIRACMQPYIDRIVNLILSQEGPPVVPPIRKTYLMDGLAHRQIIVSQQPDGSYIIEEPGGSWPWSGDAVIDGNILRGEAKFRDALTRMRVEGEIRNDGSIVVEYIFIVGADGRPSNRIDRHTWYPSS